MFRDQAERPTGPFHSPDTLLPSWFVWQAGCREGPRPRSSLSRPSSHTTMLITRTYLFATPIYDFKSSHSLFICGQVASENSSRSFPTLQYCHIKGRRRKKILHSISSVHSNSKSICNFWSNYCSGPVMMVICFIRLLSRHLRINVWQWQPIRDWCQVFAIKSYVFVESLFHLAQSIRGG